MVYNYTRRTLRASWSERTMREAINEAKKSSIKGASVKYGIPYSTLQRRVKTGSSIKKLGRFTPIFTEAEELELVQHLKDLDALFYGLTKTEFLQLVGEFAKRKNKQTPFKSNVAGKQWYKNFKKRHPEIVLRTPESTSIARLQAFNKPAVNRFYDLLQDIIEKENIRPDMIFNMDETGVRTSSTKQPKVLSVYGKKQVGAVSSLEKGTLTTVICCCSASGNFAPPPFFIFKRKRFQARLLDGSMPGCEASVSDSGWISGEIFLEWIRVFVSWVRPTQDCKALLLLDNHESHKYYPALEYATSNNVVFLTIPPHTSHKLQPLDVAVYSPFKTFFEIEINKFQKAHPGRVIGQYDIARLVTQAYLKAATPQNALSGFRAAGIQPFDRHSIPEEYFAPAAVYCRDQDIPVAETVEILSARSDSVEQPPVNVHVSEPVDITGAGSQSVAQQLENVSEPEPVQTTRAASENVKPQPENVPDQEPVEITAATSNRGPDVVQNEASPRSESVLSEYIPSELNIPNIDPMDGTTTPPIDRSQNISILQEIYPLPQGVEKKTNRRRKLQKSEVLTSTPIKIQQKDKFEKAKIKQEKTKTAKKKTQKENLKKANPSTSGLAKHQKRTSSNQPKPREKDCFCLVCKELYVDPPTEDWIMCSQCQEWAHESCTSYNGHGSYFCDFCFD